MAGELVTRRRRDAAALAFERKVYDVLRSCALLDRPIAEKSMKTAKLAYEKTRSTVVVSIQDFTITFCAHG